MQPFSTELAKALAAQPAPITIGDDAFTFRDGAIHQDRAKRSLPLTYALGGKNVFYFLTPLDRGRLQVAPLAFDVEKKRWYDVAASGVRPHANSATPLPWTDPAFTFNTSCYGCHVSQLETNYDAASNSYRTTFAAAGINCQACHGKGDPHAKPSAHEQACLPCHAKMTPLSAAYDPAQRFFDHYDLTALEHDDFYPDGRDRGENYTYTGFLRSGCALSGQTKCLTCHTSTGLFRYEATPNATCVPCHQDMAAQGEAHTHHAKASTGSRCIGCHMPQTRFAAMRRSDHSMRPPTPAATIAYQSPNACNVCHADQTAQWADRRARAWYGERYQENALREAGWVDALRRRQWTALPPVLGYLNKPDAEPVLAASLIRLLAAAPGAQVADTLTKALSHPHPLVRAAAAASLTGAAGNSALLGATNDDYRLVRIRAAAALPPAQRTKATEELIEAYNARPDDYTNQTNLGNFLLRQQRAPEAVPAFEAAIRLRPDAVGTLVNASLAYSNVNRPADAERVLRQALKYAPQSAPAHFNLGLLLAETGRLPEAQQSLRAALTADPQLAPAAYNLAVLVAPTNISEAVALCRRAVALQPGEPKYAAALAQFLRRANR